MASTSTPCSPATRPCRSLAGLAPLPALLDAQALVKRISAGMYVDGLTTTNVGLLAQGRPG
jgi:hypothetical protein